MEPVQETSERLLLEKELSRLIEFTLELEDELAVVIKNANAQKEEV